MKVLHKVNQLTQKRALPPVWGLFDEAHQPQKYLAFELDPGVQGIGLAVFRHEVTAGSVHRALLRVLTEGSFSAAAKRVSKQIRSSKRTALQEAVGEGATWLESAEHVWTQHMHAQLVDMNCKASQPTCAALHCCLNLALWLLQTGWSMLWKQTAFPTCTHLTKSSPGWCCTLRMWGSLPWPWCLRQGPRCSSACRQPCYGCSHTCFTKSSRFS